MKLTWRDAVATLLFAVIAAAYVGYLVSGGFTVFGIGAGIMDPTGMSALGLVLGMIAAFVGGWIVLHEGSGLAYLTGGLGVVSVALGLLTLVGENLFNNATVWETVLAAFIGSIVLLWGIATGRHAGLVAGGQPHAPAGLTHA
jgi:ABC-type uncharacterized transport system permease subunit